MLVELAIRPYEPDDQRLTSIHWHVGSESGRWAARFDAVRIDVRLRDFRLHGLLSRHLIRRQLTKGEPGHGAKADQTDGEYPPTSHLLIMHRPLDAVHVSMVPATTGSWWSLSRPSG